MKNKSLVITLFIVGLSVACTSRARQTSLVETEITSPSTETVVPATATSTETLTPSPTETSTITSTPTSTVGWNLLKVLSVWRDVNGYGIIFTIPTLDHNYNTTIDGKIFSCSYDLAYPDRLTCLGESFRTEYEIPVIFSAEGSGETVYTSTILVGEPAFAPTPSFPTGGVPDPRTWCPQRGQNVYCETEDRIHWDPPCLITSCFDDCGYYYSIDTCTPQNSHP